MRSAAAAARCSPTSTASSRSPSARRSSRRPASRRCSTCSATPSRRRCPRSSWPNADVSKAEMLSWEKELLGVYVSEHPFSSAAVDALEAHLGARQRDHAGDGRPRCRHRRHGEHASARSRRRPASRSSPSSVEDLSGTAEVTVWPDVYEPTREIWSARQHPAHARARPRAQRPPAGRRAAGDRSCRRPTAPSATSSFDDPRRGSRRRCGDNAGVSVASVERAEDPPPAPKRRHQPTHRHAAAFCRRPLRGATNHRRCERPRRSPAERLRARASRAAGDAPLRAPRVRRRRRRPRAPRWPRDAARFVPRR